MTLTLTKPCMPMCAEVWRAIQHMEHSAAELPLMIWFLATPLY